MASNKQLKQIREIVKKWGCSVRVYNHGTYRELLCYRGWFNKCEFPFMLMLKEIQQWLDDNPVSYRFSPEYCDGKFWKLTVVIE